MIRIALALSAAIVVGCSPPPKQTSFPTLEADSEDNNKAVKQRPCPDNVMSGAKAQGGACLDPVVLGQNVVDACARQLNDAGWKRDEVAEKSVGRKPDRPILCFREP